MGDSKAADTSASPDQPVAQVNGSDIVPPAADNTEAAQNLPLILRELPSLDDIIHLNGNDLKQIGQSILHRLDLFDPNESNGSLGQSDNHKPEGPAKGGDQSRDTELDAARKGAMREASNFDMQAEVTRGKDGKIQYRFYYEVKPEHPRDDGAPDEQKDVLTTTDANFAEQLEKKRDERIKEVESTFNVDINTNVGEKRVDGDDTFTIRKPSFEELDALSDALYRSQPDSLTGEKDEKLKVNFTDGPGDATGGFFAGKHEFWAVNLQEFDTATKQKVIEHEIAHHGQDFSDPEHGGDDYYEKLGYQKIGKDEWAVQTKSNQLYTWNDETKQFVRRDSKGNYLDADGNKVDKDKADQISGEEMRERALMPHLHETQPEAPWEFDAEAKAYFRHSEAYRTQLYVTSPDAYFQIKERDQQQIDKAYGKDENGRSKWIREPNGTLVPNTADNRQAVSDYERGLRSIHRPEDGGD